MNTSASASSISQLLPAYQNVYTIASSAAVIVFAAMIFITITTLLLRKM